MYLTFWLALVRLRSKLLIYLRRKHQRNRLKIIAAQALLYRKWNSCAASLHRNYCNASAHLWLYRNSSHKKIAPIPLWKITAIYGNILLYCQIISLGRPTVGPISQFSALRTHPIFILSFSLPQSQLYHLNLWLLTVPVVILSLFSCIPIFTGISLFSLAYRVLFSRLLSALTAA